MPILASWLTTALALMIGDRLLAGVFVGGWVPALLAAAVLGVLNVTIRPILLILTLPINLLTLGLFTFVLNAMMLGLASWLAPGFEVHSLFSGVGLAIIIAISHGLVASLFGRSRPRQRFHRNFR